MIEIKDFDLLEQVELLRATFFTAEEITTDNCGPVFKKWYDKSRDIVCTYVYKYRQLCNGSFDEEDLENAAWGAIFDAVRTYDPNNEKKASFHSYAGAAARNAVLAVVVEGTTQMLSSREKKEAAFIKNARKSFIDKTGEEPTVTELSELTCIKEDDIRIIIEADDACKKFSSIYKSNEDNETEPVSYIEDPDESIEDLVESSISHSALVSVIDSELKPREALAVKLRFGFINNTEHTYDEIGRYFGITRQGAKKIVDTAIKKLRRVLDDPYAA